jgi:hypothetical protein
MSVFQEMVNNLLGNNRGPTAWEVETIRIEAISDAENAITKNVDPERAKVDTDPNTAYEQGAAAALRAVHNLLVHPDYQKDPNEQ